MGQPGVKEVKFHPLSDAGAYFRSELLGAATFHCHNIKKINNLRILRAYAGSAGGNFKTQGAYPRLKRVHRRLERGPLKVKWMKND